METLNHFDYEEMAGQCVVSFGLQRLNELTWLSNRGIANVMRAVADYATSRATRKELMQDLNTAEKIVFNNFVCDLPNIEDL